MLAVIEQKPVCNIEAEAAILGAILSDNRMADRVADVLRVEDFADDVHGRVYAAIMDRVNRGESANVISLLPQFKDDPGFDEHLTVRRYFADITAQGAVHRLGAVDFARQVAELAKRRRLIDALSDALTTIRDTSENVSYAQALAAVEAATMTETDLGDGIVQISARDAFREMMEMPADQGPGGVTAPAMPSLNDAMGPIKPHNLIILAGRPGMGKTAVALSYAISAAQNGHGVLFISREMSRIELMQRAASCMSYDGRRGVPYANIRDNSMTEGSRRAVWEAGRAFDDMPLHIIDAGALTIGRLNMLVRRYKRRMAAQGQSLDLVVIDYLQLLSADRKTNGRYEEITDISIGLKTLGKTQDVGVMALAQLSREVEKRENKRPILSDLRDSGQIEQDADKVVFLYRDEYYLRKNQGTMETSRYEAALEACRGIIEMIVAKRRDGEEGVAKCDFHGMFMAVRG